MVYAAASSVPGYVSSQTAQPALPETEVLRNHLETGLLSQPRWLHQPPAFSLAYCSKSGAGPIAGIDSSDGLLTFSKQHGAITSPPRPSPATTRRMQLPALHPAHSRSRDHPLAACVRADAVAQHRRVAAHAISSASSPSALVQRALELHQHRPLWQRGVIAPTILLGSPRRQKTKAPAAQLLMSRRMTALVLLCSAPRKGKCSAYLLVKPIFRYALPKLGDPHSRRLDPLRRPPRRIY